MGSCEWESGISCELIVSWLRDERKLPESNKGVFQYKRAFICVTPMPDRKLSNLYLPRNAIRISGDSEDIRTFQHDFLMRFLSGGG